MLVHKMLILLVFGTLLIGSSVLVIVLHLRSKRRYDYPLVNLKSAAIVLLFVIVGGKHYFLPTLMSREMFVLRSMGGHWDPGSLGVCIVLGIDLLGFFAISYYLERKTSWLMGLGGAAILWIWLTQLFLVFLLIVEGFIDVSFLV